MRHGDTRHRLTQKPAHARMLKRNLVTSLLLYESVRTTHARARAVQPMVDRLINNARNVPAHVAIRRIGRVVTDPNASRKIIEVLVQRYAARPSGLTRVVPAGTRRGDGAMLVDLTLVDAVIGGKSGAAKTSVKAAKPAVSGAEKSGTKAAAASAPAKINNSPAKV